MPGDSPAGTEPPPPPEELDEAPEEVVREAEVEDCAEVLVGLVVVSESPLFRKSTRPTTIAATTTTAPMDSAMTVFLLFFGGWP